MKKTLLLFGFVLLVISCSKNSIRDRIKNDSTVNKVFNTNEIYSLIKIVEFVDSIVISETPDLSIDSSFHYFLDSIKTKALTLGFITEAIDQDYKYEFIFSLEPSLRRNIWRTDSIAYHIKYKDTILENLNDFPRLELKNKSKFMEYIKLLGENDKGFKELYEDVNHCGCLSQSLKAGYVINHHKLDFNKIDNHIWISVFILTLEEHIDKKVERYLKKKGSVHNIS